jgi:hypothetical protein
MGQRKDKLDGQNLSLKAEVKSDIKAAQKLWMPWWGVLLWMAFCLRPRGQARYVGAALELHRRFRASHLLETTTYAAG